jgi:phage replication O-like protein O
VENPWKHLSRINHPKEDGFTKIPNSLLEALIAAELTKAEYKVALFIWRKTSGYRKDHDVISKSQMVAATGLSMRAVKYGIDGLKAKRVIYFEPSNLIEYGKPINAFLFNEYSDTWNVEGKSTGKTLPQAKLCKNTGKNLPKHRKQLAYTKEIKENKEKGKFTQFWLSLTLV